MRALKIYSRSDEDYPNRALDLQKTQNTMILGEGAAVCCLELGKKRKCAGFHRRNWLCYRNFGTQYIYFGRSYLRFFKKNYLMLMR
jgi:hypothetical protein